MSKSIVQPEERQCYLCGRQYGLEKHHIYAGIANRRLSEREGLWVFLCKFCHTGDGGAQYEKDLNRLLKREGQRAFERTHTRKEFIQIFGKNYL